MSRGLILDLCGGTGAWSLPYKEGGFEVIQKRIKYYENLGVKKDQISGHVAT